MKILHVITSLEIGGAQRLLADLLPLQVKSEEVHLLVYKRVNNTFERMVEESGVSIICLNESNFYKPSLIFRLRKVFKRYDLVHAHLFPTIYWASIAARGLKIKLVYTEHSTSNSRRSKWYFKTIERFMYDRYDKIVSISQQTHDALTSWLTRRDDRFVVIENGVDTLKFSTVESSVVPNSLIMVSRFAASKDQETLIRAMQYISDDVTLRFVGDGENRANCEALAKELGVYDRIQFLGSRSDVPELVSSSYIGIQSSNWEGFGLTAVEMMASGKPVIASDVDGLKQVVDGAGLIFQRANVNDLVQKINNLLEDEKLYDNVVKLCKSRASLYDISIMAKKYITLYHEIFTMQ